MPAAAGGEEEGPEKRLWQRNTMPAISNTSTAMHATTMPTIAPVAKDLEGLATGATVGAREVNFPNTVENLSILMDPSPVIGSHPVVG